MVDWNNPVLIGWIGTLVVALIGWAGMLLAWFIDRAKERARARSELELEHQKLDGTRTLEQQKLDGTLKLEQQKLSGTLVLDALKTEGPEKAKQAATNLLLLADAGLVKFNNDGRDNLERWRKGEGGVAPGLPPNFAPSSRPEQAVAMAYENIRAEAAYAVTVLNQLFGRQLATPDVKPSTLRYPNAYFDRSTNTIHAPPEVQHLPDVIYHVVGHLYLPEWNYEGEAAALIESLADVLSAVIKQRRLDQTAQTADWLVTPKGRAWISGEDPATTKKLAPLRSLKAPGTAYPGDPQVDHMTKYSQSAEARYDPHAGSGVPSKAFHDAAQKLGTDKAADVWVKAVVSEKLSTGRQPTFAVFAGETASQAVALHGEDARKALLESWKGVGVELAQ
jgi:hypothetical protein